MVEPVTMAALGMSAASTIGGFMSSNKTAKQLKKMRKAMQRRTELARERFEHYTDTYGGIEQQMVNDAMQGVNPDLEQVEERARADVAGSFDRQEAEQRRQLQGMGLDPSSGRYQSSDRQMDINQAATEAMQVNNARRSEDIRAENETRRMRQQVGQFGGNMMQQGARDLQQSQAAEARMFGQQAQQYGQMAGNMFSSAGQMGMFGLDQMSGSPADAGGGTQAGLDAGGGSFLDTGFANPEGGSFGAVRPQAGLNFNDGSQFNMR